ncbi:TPA: dCTP deaminase [Candidatus Falkowbacteria bacterium]|nr:dCTP deaminase [Candidatus Falkowbacteria bacterium]
MSILTRPAILQKITAQELKIEPELDEYQLQPASIDLRIGWSFYIPYIWKFTDKGRVAVVADYMDYSTTHENFQLVKLKPEQYFEILPGEMILASSLEKVTLSGKLCGVLHARSSASRRGLAIESGVVNPHYSGHLTIPITNQSHHVLKIYPGERLCQMVLHELQTDMSTEDAQMHGLDASKYDSATPYGLTSKLDSHAELDILRSGNLDQLKKKT